MSRIPWKATPLLLAAPILVAVSGRANPEHRGPVTDIDIRRGTIYSCSQSGVNAHTGKRLTPFRDLPFRVLSIAPFGDRLVLAGGVPGESGAVSLLDIKTRKTEPVIPVGDDLIYSIASTDDSGFAALADGRILEIGLVLPGAATRLLHRHTAPARTVRISADGRFLASGGLDRLVILSDLNQEMDRVAIQDHTGPVECLTFSPDGSRIASGARDGKVRIHAVPGGKLIRTYAGLEGKVLAVAWGGKPERLFAGTSSGRIYRLDLESDSAASVAARGEDRPVFSLAIDSKGRMFAGSQETVEEIPAAASAE